MPVLPTTGLTPDKPKQQLQLIMPASVQGQKAREGGKSSSKNSIKAVIKGQNLFPFLSPFPIRVYC